MEALVLECPQCGAASAPEAVRCSYCGVALATARCASCFGLNFVGTKHCSHCGAKTLADAPGIEGAHKCPRCKKGMTPTAIGTVMMDECAGCGGVWLDTAAFEQVCKDRNTNLAIFGAGSPLALPDQNKKSKETRVSYVPCPQCSRIMNRVNFVGCSGVIVDVCKGHGTWFDKDELRMVIEFIRGGGMQLVLEKEKSRIEEEKRKLHERETIQRYRDTSLLDNETPHVGRGGVSLIDLFHFLVR